MRPGRPRCPDGPTTHSQSSSAVATRVDGHWGNTHNPITRKKKRVPLQQTAAKKAGICIDPFGWWGDSQHTLSSSCVERERPRGNKAGVIILTGCDREMWLMRADQGTYYWGNLTGCLSVTLQRITIQTQFLNIHLEKGEWKTSIFSETSGGGTELQAELFILTGTVTSDPGRFDSCVFPLM